MNQVENIEYSQMMPTDEGLIKLNRKAICFLGQSHAQVLASVQKHYSPMFDYPIGTEDFSKHWAWGYFRMTNGIRTFKGAMQNPEETCLFHFQELQGPPNKHYEGALVQAKRVFKLFENNPDMVLFIQYNEFIKEKL